MPRIKTVGIKELKNNLSACIREVQDGTVVLVRDRSRPVAELRPHGAAAGPRSAAARAAEWEQQGRLVAPTTRKRPLEASPVRLRAGTSRRLLDRDRPDA